MENWKTIEGYEDYQVSDLGRVKSLKRNKELILKHRLDNDYPMLNIWSNGHKKYCTIHRLMAKAFLSDFSETLSVDHINGDRSDNRLINLQMVSVRDNSSLCYRSDRTKMSSKFPGVYWNKQTNKWRSHITIGNKQKYLGAFEIEQDAANAYRNALTDLK